MKKFLLNLIKNNTGISSKNFFLVVVTIIGCILLLVPAIILLTEIFTTHTITTDLTGLATYIGSVASVLASAGVTKTWSEKYEHRSIDSSGDEPLS